MSFTIKSIELKNIRAHEYFMFEPALEGTTAISGDNGAGKSTIVDAFAWSLYGTRPSGVKNRNLIKDGVDPKEKPVSVKSIVLIGGIEYVIERKIISPSGTTECNVWGKNPDSNEFTQVAGPAVTHVEKFIRNEIGMNEKGFLTSVLIQQKQVDQIVSATPRERGVVIEELTGIASITQAIQKTNENTRALEKASSIFQVGDVDEATNKVSSQEVVCETLETREQEAFKKFNEIKSNYNELKEKLSVEAVKVNKSAKLTRNVESYRKQNEFLKKQSQDDLAYIADFESKYGSEIVVDTKKLRGEVTEKRKELYGVQSKETSTASELKRAKADLKKATTLKGEFKTQKAAKEKLSELNTSLSANKKQLEESKNKKSMYTSEIKHAKASHDHINGEDKNCPVCKSVIEDPESLRGQIEEDIEDYNNKVKSAIRDIVSFEDDISKVESEILKVNYSIEAIKEAKLLAADESKLKGYLEELSTQIDQLKIELNLLETEYDKALKFESDNTALKSAKSRSSTVNNNIDSNNVAIDESLNKVSELKALSDIDYKALIDKVDLARNDLGAITITGKEIRGRKILEKERLSDYEKNLEMVEEAVKRYNDLAERIEVSTSASAMLSAFKADRIEHAIPTLEFFASDFLSKFTGGAFAKLSVDEKFNTFVTTTEGVVRPVAQLSGGELSSAAIALRLGIAMLLNSSEKNVLILDEVLVSMDEDRSRQIMETIGSMTNSQIIFIAHNSDINSVADKTVLVTK